MYEGQVLGTSSTMQDSARMQAMVAQNQSINVMKQREQSAVEESLDRLAKILELATMNADALLERLGPVSCVQPKGNSAGGVLSGTSAGCHIEARIETLTDRLANLSQKLTDHREALRI